MRAQERRYFYIRQHVATILAITYPKDKRPELSHMVDSGKKTQHGWFTGEHSTGTLFWSGNMATSNSHLLIFFCATAGKNGEELGNDEEQIVLFVYLLYDVSNCKVRQFTGEKNFPHFSGIHAIWLRKWYRWVIIQDFRTCLGT